MVMGLLGNDIKIKVGAEKDCIQTLSVELPVARVKASIEKAFQGVQSQAKLPGFRPGKTPIDLIKKNFKETAYGRAQDALLREGVTAAIQEKKIRAIDAPVVQSVNFDPEKPFQFEFQVEVMPSFKLASYKGLKLKRPKADISDADLDKRLLDIAEGNARLVESKAESLSKEHYAMIDYEGFIDGKAIPGTKTDNFAMDLSAPQSISGLVEGLVGAKPGDERDVKVTFPVDSPAKELAGKEATFHVKVHAIKEKNAPALDDEFAKDLGLSSFAELKTRVRESMESEAKKQQRRELERQIVDGLTEAHPFAVPPSLVKKQAENLKQRHQYRLQQQGFSKGDQESMLARLEPETAKAAEREVRLAYVLNAISEQEKLEVTEDDISAKISEIAAQSGEGERGKMEEILRGPYKDQLRSELKDAKIFDFLIEHAKVKDQ